MGFHTRNEKICSPQTQYPCMAQGSGSPPWNPSQIVRGWLRNPATVGNGGVSHFWWGFKHAFGGAGFFFYPQWDQLYTKNKWRCPRGAQFLTSEFAWESCQVRKWDWITIGGLEPGVVVGNLFLSSNYNWDDFHWFTYQLFLGWTAMNRWSRDVNRLCTKGTYHYIILHLDIWHCVHR